MDINNIYELMERFSNMPITGMDLKFEGVELSLKKDISVQMGAIEHLTSTDVINPSGISKVSSGVGAITQDAAPKALKQTIDENANDDKNVVEVKSPLVGTFYRAASPEDKPFVVSGQEVKKGEVIGIIEAMKLMNEIIAPVDGVVTFVSDKDGDMVQYDEVLIKLREN